MNHPTNNLLVVLGEERTVLLRCKDHREVQVADLLPFTGFISFFENFLCIQMHSSFSVEVEGPEIGKLVGNLEFPFLVLIGRTKSFIYGLLDILGGFFPDFVNLLHLV